MMPSFDDLPCSFAWLELRSKPCWARPASRCSYILRGSFVDEGLLFGHVVLFSVTKLGRSPRQFWKVVSTVMPLDSNNGQARQQHKSLKSYLEVHKAVVLAADYADLREGHGNLLNLRAILTYL